MGITPGPLAPHALVGGDPVTTLLAFAALWILASIAVAALLSLLGVPRHQDEELPPPTQTMDLTGWRHGP